MDVKALAAIALTIIVAAPIGIGYLLNIEDVERDVWIEGDVSTDITDPMFNSTSDSYADYNGLKNNEYVYENWNYEYVDYVLINNNYSTTPILGATGTYSWTITYGVNNIPPAEMDGTWAVDLPAGVYISFQYASLDGQTHWHASSPTDPTTVTKTADALLIQHDEGIWDLDRISNLSFRLSRVGDVTLDVTLTGVTGYGIQSYGWHAPTNANWAGPDADGRWINGYDNREIILTIDLEETSKTYIYISSDESGPYIYVEKEADGDVIIGTYNISSGVTTEWGLVNLGTYQYIQLDIRNDGLTASGLDSWPTMGVVPLYYNQQELEFTHTNNHGYIDKLIFREDPINTGANIYRVDNAKIRSGYYPISENASTYMDRMYPGMTSAQVQILKVDLHGDSITFADQTFNVSNGKIILANHRTVPIEGAKFKTYSADGVTWNNYINGYEVGDTDHFSNVTFNGRWSAVWKSCQLDLVKETATEWVPGHFGIDMEWFALLGLMTCAALTVLLGLYGKRSGSKMIWLMIITGGASLIFFMML